MGAGRRHQGGSHRMSTEQGTPQHGVRSKLEPRGRREPHRFRNVGSMRHGHKVDVCACDHKLARPLYTVRDRDFGRHQLGGAEDGAASTCSLEHSTANLLGSRTSCPHALHSTTVHLQYEVTFVAFKLRVHVQEPDRSASSQCNIRPITCS
jgi:hypothetical protein